MSYLPSPCSCEHHAFIMQERIRGEDRDVYLPSITKEVDEYVMRGFCPYGFSSCILLYYELLCELSDKLVNMIQYGEGLSGEISCGIFTGATLLNEEIRKFIVAKYTESVYQSIKRTTIMILNGLLLVQQPVEMVNNLHYKQQQLESYLIDQN